MGGKRRTQKRAHDRLVNQEMGKSGEQGTGHSWAQRKATDKTVTSEMRVCSSLRGRVMDGFYVLLSPNLLFL